MGKTKSAEALVLCLGSVSALPTQKRAAFEALNKFGENCVSFAIPLLRSEYWYARYKAVALLSEHGSPQHLSVEEFQTLHSLTRDSQKMVADEASALLAVWN